MSDVTEGLGEAMRVDPRSGRGNLMARTLGIRPALLSAVSELLTVFTEHSTLEPRLRELARQAVAPIVGCRYCQTLGHDAGPVGTRERAAVAYAVQLAKDPASVSDELWSELSLHLNSDEVVDLTAFVAYVAIGGQTLGAALGLPEATADEAAEFQAQVSNGKR